MDSHGSTEHPIDVSSDVLTIGPAVATGTVLGEPPRYHVGECIGGGGMADVYRGWDLVLRRTVAIKVLKPMMASQDLCERMQQEARVTASIDDPHLLRATDFGRVGPTVYLVTDMLRGLSLADLLRHLPDHRLPWQRAIDLFLPALRALHQAHEAGVLHRDLKPDNLFVHRRGDEDVLIVLDLGIAKLLQPQAAPDGVIRTETGRLLGTPAYMSPEQVSGLPLDRRTDIYSIGVTLFRALSGQQPFVVCPGDTPQILMARHVHDDPLPLAILVPSLPAALVEAVTTAMARAPSMRHASMLELAAALRACLSDTPSPPFERSGHFARIKRVSGGGLILGALLATQVRGPRAEVAPDEPASPSPAATAASEVVSRPLVTEARVTSSDGAADGPGRAIDATDGSRPAEPTAGAQPPVSDPAASRAPTVRRRPNRSAAAIERVLERAAPAISRCITTHADVDFATLRASLRIGADGRVMAVDLGDRDVSAFTLCARPVLERLAFEPGREQVIRREFQRGGKAGSP